MPKMKTHSGAKKRFKATGTGRLKRKGANKNHILAKKSRTEKRRSGAPHYVSKVDQPRMEQLLAS